MKRTSIAVAVLAALLLTGCAGSVEEPAIEPQSAPADVETQAPETPEPKAEKMSAANSADITAAGEVCDPSNMNDAICAAFYPDQAVLNITARADDLSGLSDAEKIERAQQACEGGESADSALYKAGAIAYCNELAPGIEGQPDRYARLIAFYQGLGEAGAKDHYSERVMPTPAELGY